MVRRSLRKEKQTRNKMKKFSDNTPGSQSAVSAELVEGWVECESYSMQSETIGVSLRQLCNGSGKFGVQFSSKALLISTI